MFNVKRLFDGNAAEVKRLEKIVAAVDALGPKTAAQSDEQLAQTTQRLRLKLAGGEKLDTLIPEAFAAVREAGGRKLQQTHFRVQLIGGLALHKGHIAEMRTGEGKTLVASLALYLNALEGKGAHLITTNGYLAKTGAGWMAPIYHALGMSVAYIAHDESARYDPNVTLDMLDWRHQHWAPVSRKQAYAADITYGQNSEFGFDYLRDNMALDASQTVQRGLHFGIVDEADSILIDEARTPLIISSAAPESEHTYQLYAQIVAALVLETDYVLEEKKHAVIFTESGISKAEEALGVKNLYEEGATAIHYLDNALKARALYRKDQEYIVNPDGEVVIIDEFTGRQMPGRRWSDGLHQAVEAKEGVAVQKETQTHATVTIQNYFRMYTKLSGMTGTAATEAEELFKVYKLEVTQIPTNRPMLRQDEKDIIYRTAPGKWEAIIKAVQERNERGQPVLIGTTSVEKSHFLSQELDRSGITHRVLNAKNHEQEAEVIAQAGQKGKVTVATNMAGRGVDILLGPGVVELGGLHVIGTEHHEARRIDNQLRGRAGRQGDPGSTRFYVSLEDDLIRIFAGERLRALMDKLGFNDQAPIESGMITNAINGAQVRVEGNNFDMRKRGLEFDDVLNAQRTLVYAERKKILEQSDVKETVLDYLHDAATAQVDALAGSPDPEDWDTASLAAALGALLNKSAEITPATFEKAETAKELELLVEELVDNTYQAWEAGIGSELARAVERAVLLQTIDSHWVGHLTAMEELREGIYLRGYGQQDPLVEYKGEARSYFEEMTRRVEHGVANAILRTEITAATITPDAGA